MRGTLTALTVALTLAGCGQSQPATSDGTLHAVATVFPLTWMLEHIAPDADVMLLGQGGQGPHGVQLSPADREAVETADVVLYMGDIGFQPQIEEAVRTRRGRIVSVTAVIGDQALRTDTAQARNGESHGAVDPHAWFDAGLMTTVAEQVGEVFAAADPDHGAAYQANAVGVARQLAALDTEIARTLSGCRFDEAIVSHEAYAYLLLPHGLTQRGIAGMDPEAGASPARLAELAERIRAEGIPAVLAEPVEGRADAEALAREAGVALLEINPLENVTDRAYQIGYVALLRQQAKTFAKALQCSGNSSDHG